MRRTRCHPRRSRRVHDAEDRPHWRRSPAQSKGSRRLRIQGLSADSEGAAIDVPGLTHELYIDRISSRESDVSHDARPARARQWRSSRLRRDRCHRARQRHRLPDPSPPRARNARVGIIGKTPRSRTTNSGRRGATTSSRRRARRFSRRRVARYRVPRAIAARAATAPPGPLVMMLRLALWLALRIVGVVARLVPARGPRRLDARVGCRAAAPLGTTSAQAACHLEDEHGSACACARLAA